MREYDLVIIGGGAAGILSSIEAKKKGINNIIVIEKDPVIGGMLSSIDYPINKDKTVTGKEYKEALLKELQDHDVEVQLNTMVLKIEDKEVVCTSATNGIEKIKGKNIIIANGGREGGRKAIDMVGDRCSGIYNVSMTKKIFAMNMIPGKKVFIYGNATLYMIEEYLKNSNIEVVGIVTTNGKETYGLTDNIYEGYTIESIDGEGRVSSVKLVKGNEEKIVNCDTLIFSMPMISDGIVSMRSGIQLNPETAGTKVDEKFQTSKEGIFAIGNGIYIHNYIEDIEKECCDVINNIF